MGRGGCPGGRGGLWGQRCECGRAVPSAGREVAFGVGVRQSWQGREHAWDAWGSWG